MLSLYVNNFKCLQELRVSSPHSRSLMLAGKNGAGKSAIMDVFIILQSIGRGVSQINPLILPENLTAWSTVNVMTIILEADIKDHRYKYVLILEIMKNFLNLTIKKETLYFDDNTIMLRADNSVKVSTQQMDVQSDSFALPIIPVTDVNNPILIFRSWLSQIFLLRPNPAAMGDFHTQPPNSFINLNCDNFASIIMNYMSSDFSLFEDIRKYVRTFMPDFFALKSAPMNNFAQNRLLVSFSGLKKDIPFYQLSDGEKIFILQGLILALSSRWPDMFVFWDEPDNYLARNEIQGFIMNLRSAFTDSGQIIITSHNEQAALAFSPESVVLLNRPNHHSATRIVTIPEDADFPEFLTDNEYE